MNKDRRGGEEESLNSVASIEMSEDGTSDGDTSGSSASGEMSEDGRSEEESSGFATSSEMSEDGTSEDSRWNSLTAGKLANNRHLRLKAQCEQLLPGIPNEITLDHIISKLPWTAFHTLASVSRCWRQAIRSHEVFKARVRTHSTETFVVLNVRCDDDVNILVIYSPRDKSSHPLPPIPHPPDEARYERLYRCASWEGRIYALGGLSYGNIHSPPGGEVYMLDLAAGERQWKQCASMKNERDDFGFGVVDGKIYAFDGRVYSYCYPAGVCEVYDPNEDAWSPTKPFSYWRFDYQVATMGKELFVYGGRYADRDLPAKEIGGDNPLRDAEFVEIYDTIKDEWRLVKAFMHHSDVVFLAQGRFHRVTSVVIEVHDLHKNSWTPLQRNSFASVEAATLASVKPIAALYVNDEILLVAYFHKDRGLPILRLLQSVGFGNQHKDIVWGTTKCPILLNCLHAVPPHLCPIQL